MGAIIISPTRELATQIFNVLAKFLEKFPNLKQILLVGGSNTVKDDISRLQNGKNIIVATPGRLEDLLSNHKESNLATAVKSLVFIALSFLKTKI